MTEPTTDTSPYWYCGKKHIWDGAKQDWSHANGGTCADGNCPGNDDVSPSTAPVSVPGEDQTEVNIRALHQPETVEGDCDRRDCCGGPHEYIVCSECGRDRSEGDCPTLAAFGNPSPAPASVPGDQLLEQIARALPGDDDPADASWREECAEAVFAVVAPLLSKKPALPADDRELQARIRKILEPWASTRGADGDELWDAVHAIKDLFDEIEGGVHEDLHAELAKARKELAALNGKLGERGGTIFTLADNLAFAEGELATSREELAELQQRANEVRKYWIDWPQARRDAVRGLSAHVHDAVVALVESAAPVSSPEPEGQTR